MLAARRPRSGVCPGFPARISFAGRVEIRIELKAVTLWKQPNKIPPCPPFSKGEKRPCKRALGYKDFNNGQDDIP